MTIEYWFFCIGALGFSMFLMIMVFRTHRLTSPNVISVMYLFHIAQQVGASLVLLADPEASYAPFFFLLNCTAALLIPIGGIFGSMILPARNTSKKEFRYGPIDDSLIIRRKSWHFFVLYLFFCSMLFALYISKIGQFLLFGLLAGQIDPTDAVAMRGVAMSGSTGLIFGIGLRFLMPLLFALGFIGLGYFQALVARMSSLLAMIIALLYNGWSAAKTPVAMLFLLAVIIIILQKDEFGKKSWFQKFNLTRLKKRLRHRRRRFYILCAIFAIIVVVYPIFIFLFMPAGQQGLEYVLEHVLLRIFWKPALNSYAAFEAFSSSMAYTNFADIYKLSKLAGWEYIDLSQKIAVYKGQASFSNAPPPAVGNFYAQGGWMVVIIGVLFASMLFKFLENVFYRAKIKSIVYTALYAMLLFGAFRFSWANFHTILATELISPLLFILFFWGVFKRFHFALINP